MTILLAVTGLGFFCSFAIHVCTMLNLYRPSHGVIIAQNAGVGIVFLAMCIISKRLRRGIEKESFKKNMNETFPEWMQAMLGFFGIYCLVIACVFFYKAFKIAIDTENVEATLVSFHRGLSAILAVFYAMELSVVNSYRLMVKRHRKTCPNGHSLSMLSTNCQECGLSLE